MNRILDWEPRFDERSRQYPVRSVIKREWSTRRREKLWRLGQILDQGQEGACVGFSWTAEALSTPVAVDLNKLKATAPSDPNKFAHFIYQQAKKIDEWAGEDYDGTSVLAGVKAVKTVGLVREYRWAFNIQDVVDTVLAKGPVVVGTYWYSGMWEPDTKGLLRPTGSIVGGHAYTVVGYTLDVENGEDAFIIQNSWGPSWGNKGTAKIKVSDLARLLKNQGEACVPYKRSYGR